MDNIRHIQPVISRWMCLRSTEIAILVELIWEDVLQNSSPPPPSSHQGCDEGTQKPPVELPSRSWLVLMWQGTETRPSTCLISLSNTVCTRFKAICGLMLKSVLQYSCIARESMPAPMRSGVKPEHQEW